MAFCILNYLKNSSSTVEKNKCKLLKYDSSTINAQNKRMLTFLSKSNSIAQIFIVFQSVENNKNENAEIDAHKRISIAILASD